mmetsp:Transcript_29187/g.33511  ORF Transcript_29187/g.33511 Transcript_29187/m.33511 type:complete len:519 (-) Transcript_29187:182-1738(-)
MISKGAITTICNLLLLMKGIFPSTAYHQVTAPRKYFPISYTHRHRFLGTDLSPKTSCTNARSTGLNLMKDDEANGLANDEGGMVLTNQFLSDRASLLESAFDAMDDIDKYDAVLTGICSKILDGQVSSGGPQQIAIDATLTPTQLAMNKMNDPIRLMEEMNSRKVKASSRSLMGLIDAASTTSDSRTIAKTLSLISKNGSLKFYGSLQSSINALPPTPNSKIPKSRMTRAERLATLPEVPMDERGKEVSAALATMSIVGISFIFQGVGNGLGLDELAFYTSLLSSGILGVLFLDNFFDVIKSFGSFIVKMNSEKIPDAVKNVNAPDKEDMPLELGSGKITGTIVKGLTRLWSVDTERDCQCEAAAFYTAYSLGLPCFSFRPNALEAAVLVFESDKDDGNYKLDSLLSDTGIMKMLIWLMAPIAIESSLHPQLITSDPREARGFLMRLKEKAALFDAEDAIDNLLQNGDQEMEDLLKWSYAEADSILRQNSGVVNDLTQRLIGGASTIGDCVSVLEEWV